MLDFLLEHGVGTNANYLCSTVAHDAVKGVKSDSNLSSQEHLSTLLTHPSQYIETRGIDGLSVLALACLEKNLLAAEALLG